MADLANLILVIQSDCNEEKPDAELNAPLSHRSLSALMQGEAVAVSRLRCKLRIMHSALIRSPERFKSYLPSRYFSFQLRESTNCSALGDVSISLPLTRAIIFRLSELVGEAFAANARDHTYLF